MKKCFYDELDRQEKAIFEALSNNLTNNTNQEKNTQKQPNKELYNGEQNKKPTYG